MEQRYADGSAPAFYTESPSRSHLRSDDTSQRAEPGSIVVSATFTADLICEPLHFWCRKLDLKTSVRLAPYAQVIQQLLSPESDLARNETGFNVLLLRLEDWVRERAHGVSEEDNIGHLRDVAAELALAFDVLRKRSAIPLLVILCPSSPRLSPTCSAAIENIQRNLHARLTGMKRVYCWMPDEIARLYPLAECHDARADRLAHIPYSHEYFVSLATFLVRQISALSRPPRKVIALDCDNTLWAGICGEVGPDGVHLTDAHRRFQGMLVRLHDAGTLLCLCSKNNEADVEAVFAQRPEMPLRTEHFVACRINWEAKSGNLTALSRELDLSLDSFVFIDDSALECEEVRVHAPSVLTLQFPQAAEEREQFIDHTWVFDCLEVSADARRRTEQYRQNRARRVAQEQSNGDLKEFLASLALEVEVAPMQADELTRVAELVQRTNQFNLTGVRRRASEIESLCRSTSLHALVVRARDRFGDYGLVGAVLYQAERKMLAIDTFVLSCRALGRGVEHRIVNELGCIAARERREEVRLRLRPSPRNTPAREFLQHCFAQFKSTARTPEGSEEVVFSVPTHVARSLSIDAAPSDAGSQGEASQSIESNRGAVPSQSWHQVVWTLRNVQDVVDEMAREAGSARRERDVLVAPRTDAERAIAGIWCELLRVDRVGVTDDFFELGGDSLLAVRVVARVGYVLKAELSLGRFFDAPTVESLAAHVEEASPALPAVERRPPTPGTPLSFAQERLWFLTHFEGGSAAYHIPEAFRLRGVLDRAALRAALDALLERHEALRTVFISAGDAPEQRVLSNTKFELREIDLQHARVPEDQRSEILRNMQEELAAPFDFGSGPLVRGRLLQLNAEEHVLLITMHHIVSDGWSVGLLLRELSALFEAFRHGRQNPLPQLAIGYADYAYRQRHSTAGALSNDQLQYWTNHLRGAPALLELPADYARPTVPSYRGANLEIDLGIALATRLRAFSRAKGLTLPMLLHAAWVILLARLSGQRDIVVGIPVANRRRTEFEGLVGFFVNTLAVRVRVREGVRVSAFLDHVKTSFLGAYAHQDAPFEQVVEAVQPARSLSYSPLFQCVFVMQNAPRESLRLVGLRAERLSVPLQTAQFDLTLSLEESCGDIVGFINYTTDLFTEETIQRWRAALILILQRIIDETDTEVDRLPLLSDAARQEIIEGFNNTRADFPRERWVHELFEEQVRATPDAIAVTCGDERLTYAELNLRANRLALVLRREGVWPGEILPVLLPRCLQLLIAQIACFKCGAVFVPLDPELPIERRAFVVKDTMARRVLSGRDVDRSGMPEGLQWIDCDRLDGTDDACDVSLGAAHEPAAYVMYTSGSTGVPKGVVVPHHAITRLVRNNGYAPISPTDCIPHYSNPTFDASTFEIWGPLLNGGRIVIFPHVDVLEGEHFAQRLMEEGVTILWMSVGLFNRYTEVFSKLFPRLRYLIVGGDTLDPRSVRRVLKHSPPQHFLNAYGPTECTTFSTTHWVRSPQACSGPIPIGRPIGNARVYILDRHLQPVPVGVTGELYIGGEGVASGYLNREELTAERFVSDPFSARPGARMYRTGDLGRWRADGVIEFLGRNDHQVKIRGFRIEPGEIEAQLVRHPQVKEAVVLAREDVPGEKRLVGYVIPVEAGNLPTVESLRAHLKAVLPEYMVPSAFVLLGQLPLTSNGKLDRGALPAPEQGAFASRQYEAPRGEVEEILAGIWQQLLGVQQVGRDDNFFELGGHSLLIVQMMQRLRRVGLRAEVRQVFESPTLADLAMTLRQEGSGEYTVPPNLIPPGSERITPSMLPLVQLDDAQIEHIVSQVPGGAGNIQDIYPLAPLQEGILFHHLLSGKAGDAYVVPTLLALSSQEKLEQLIQALQGVIDRHDVLRTAILWEQLPQPVQVVYRQAKLPVDEVQLDDSRDALEQVRGWLAAHQQRLDLRLAPLARLQVARDPHSSRCFALLRFHHIVGDHVTAEIVTAECVARLNGGVPLTPPSACYRQHVAQALQYSRLQDSETFFREKLGDIQEPTAPFGVLDLQCDVSQIEEAAVTVDPAVGVRVRAHARRLNVSPATLFHAAWALVVAHTSASEDVVFGSVLLGRLSAQAGAQQAAGMFINTLPVRLTLGGLSARELIERTQRELVALLAHEHASLAVAQRCSGVAPAAPLFSTLLNFRHSAPDPSGGWGQAEGLEFLGARDRTNYPVTLSVDDFGERFGILAQTDRAIDPHRMVAYMVSALRSLIDALEHAPHTLALQLDVLPAEERRLVLDRFNATQEQFPQDVLVHELVDQQARRLPRAIAVTHDHRQLTYAELNRSAAQLAAVLVERGVTPGSVVGVCMDRSVEMVVALLGILKAGAAYMPLDPNYPRERLQYMLKDASPDVVLITEALRSTLPATDALVIPADTLLRQIEADREAYPFSTLPRPTPDNLLYVIYTSGSTGQPKGTAMPHAAMINLLEWHRRTFGSAVAQMVLQFAALSFDVAFQEVFSTLSTGGTLVMLDEAARRDVRALMKIISQHRVSRLFVPPLMLQSLAEYAELPESLRDIITAGEQLRISTEIVSLFKRLPSCRLHNHYGPTETHVVTALTLPDDPATWPTLPSIGCPISNCSIYVLDPQMHPVGVGVCGEIYIGGGNLARGYLHREELTAQRFVKHPFDPREGARLYRTGDIGRWEEDGALQYLGRNDSQVKIRGYRIELGEVEAQLARHPDVREVIVVARADNAGAMRLVAYVTARAERTLVVGDLRRHAAAHLPEYMVPSAFLVLEKLPLTPSGKADRRALPAPQTNVSNLFEAPLGRMEETLARIWGQLLAIDRIGRDDNFFELGGHSLHAMRLIVRIETELGARLPASGVFRYPTIRKMAQFVASTLAEGSEYSELEGLDVEEGVV